MEGGLPPLSPAVHPTVPSPPPGPLHSLSIRACFHPRRASVMEPARKQHQRTVVWVRRQFHHREVAAYDLAKIEGWHQTDVGGGRHARANRRYWHGYVWCDAMIEGSIAHSCTHGPPPH